MRAIRYPVGKGSVNQHDDVAAIQQLLNQVSVNEGGPTSPLSNLGTCGSETINAIMRFQLRHIPRMADGRVDPGGQTLALLNNYDRAGTSERRPASPSIAPTPPAKPAGAAQQLNPQQLAKTLELLAISRSLANNPAFARLDPSFPSQLRQGISALETALTSHGYPTQGGPPVQANVGVLIVMGLTIAELIAIGVAWNIIVAVVLLPLYRKFNIALYKTFVTVILKVEAEANRLKAGLRGRDHCAKLFKEFDNATLTTLKACRSGHLKPHDLALALQAWYNVVRRLAVCLGASGAELLLIIATTYLAAGGTLLDFIVKVLGGTPGPLP
ncbi:MAG: peptidoglycan-binding domain-containing protein [Acidobacteriota bacterium]